METHELALAHELRFTTIEKDISTLQSEVKSVCDDVSKMKTETAVTNTIVTRIEKVMWWILTGVIGSVFVSIIIAVLKR